MTLFYLCYGIMAGKRYNLRSDGYNYTRYSSVLTDKSSEVFSVQSCSNAHVVLTEVAGLPYYKAYELVIGAGENDEVVLKDGVDGTIIDSVGVNQILSCAEKR